MLALSLLITALAGDLLHDETVDADAAVALAGRWVRTESLTAYSLQQALGEAGSWRQSRGAMPDCAPNADALTELVREIELAIRHVEYDAAGRAFDGDLPCAETPFERQLSGRAWLLNGYVKARQDRTEDAARAFARAAVLDPALSWDETYPPVGRETFEATAEQTRADRVQLRVVPLPVASNGRGGALRVLDDGHVTIDGSVFGGNRGAVGAGAILVGDGTLILGTTTFEENISETLHGGAIQVSESGRLTMNGGR